MPMSRTSCRVRSSVHVPPCPAAEGAWAATLPALAWTTCPGSGRIAAVANGPVVVPGLGCRGDRPLARGDRGGAGARGADKVEAAYCAVGPVRASAGGPSTPAAVRRADAALMRMPRRRTALVVRRVKPMLGCCAGAPLSARTSSIRLHCRLAMERFRRKPSLRMAAVAESSRGLIKASLGETTQGLGVRRRAPIPHGPCESQFATQHGSWGRRHRRPRSLALGSGEVGTALSPPAAARGNSGRAGVTAYSPSDLFERRRVLMGDWASLRSRCSASRSGAIIQSSTASRSSYARRVKSRV